MNDEGASERDSDMSGSNEEFRHEFEEANAWRLESLWPNAAIVPH